MSFIDSYKSLEKLCSEQLVLSYKSYAAVVLKHLFEDPVESIRPFLSKQMLIPFLVKFSANQGQVVLI